MKRTIAFLLACLMVFSLVACGKKNAEGKTGKSKETETQESSSVSGKTAGEEAEESGISYGEEVQPDEDGVIRIPYSSLDELNNELGGKVKQPVSVTVENESMYLVNENGVEIEQYFFTISDIPCGIRFSPDFKSDISGAKKEDGTGLLAGVHGDYTTEFDGCEVAHWETVDGQYVLVVASNEMQLFEPLLEEMKILASGAEIIIDENMDADE